VTYTGRGCPFTSRIVAAQRLCELAFPNPQWYVWSDLERLSPPEDAASRNASLEVGGTYA